MSGNETHVFFTKQLREIESFSGIIGAVTGAVIGMRVMKSLPGKRFPDFRVVLIGRKQKELRACQN